ncbi:ABC transporter substrate-binding protein, partial [candidate division WOR-3 bacterium]|nr:ABC transporter substrate-binding protein [candidate division WOR-3 bacterium]
MLALVLVMVLLASVLPLAVTPAAAYEEKIPFAGEDNELTKDELVNAILTYMLGEGDFKLDDIGDAAWVYAYWNGKPKTVTDMADKGVALYRPPERVAALSHVFIQEVMFVFGVPEDALVAIGGCSGKVGSYNYTYKGEQYTYTGSGYPSDVLYPKCLELPNVGRIDDGINYEVLANAQPEFVIIRVCCCQSEENVERVGSVIESLGIPVVIIKDPRSYDVQNEDIIYN